MLITHDYLKESLNKLGIWAIVIATFLVFGVFSQNAFGEATEPNYVTTDKESYATGETIRISGFIKPQATYYSVDVTLLIQDSIGNIVSHTKLTPASDGTFQTSIVASGQLWIEAGEYSIKANYLSQTTKTTFYFTKGTDTAPTPKPQLDSTQIPQWIKQVGEFWIEDKIDDAGFVQVIEFLVKEGIIRIPYAEAPESEAATKIPSWIKSNTEFWVTGKISDDEFTIGLEWLINNGIIRV